MANRHVALMTLTERQTPSEGRILTGRMGFAVVVGRPIPPKRPGEPQRWRITLVEPIGSSRGWSVETATGAELDELAGRADR
jgi:hypothetical protein